MTWFYDPVGEPEEAKTEALRKIAEQLERIADAQEEEE